MMIVMGCEGLIFEEDDNSYIIIDSEEEKVELLNGIYAYLVKIHGSGYLATLSRSDDINIYSNYSFYYPGQTGNFGCSYLKVRALSRMKLASSTKKELR